jgi:two-component system sensor histidine kinase HydH
MSNPLHPYELLKSIIQLSTSSIPIQVKLDQILQSISGAFQSDRCLFLKPEQIGKSAFFSHLVSEKKPLWVEEDTFFQKENVLSEEEDLLCPTFACIPLVDETSSQGILYISFSKDHRFSPEEVDLLLLIGEALEGAIRNEALHDKAEETISELTALCEMGKAVTSTLKLGNLFELTVTMGLRILKARGGVLRVEDKRTGELEVKWSVGDYHQNPFDEKIARRVFHSQTPLSLNPSPEGGPSLSVLCAPFLSKGRAFGTLAFYEKDSDSTKFDEKDFQLLLMMANQMSCAIDNALIHYETSEMAQEHEKRVKELSTLWELNKALLTTVNFDRILHLTLTAITIGEGLKFNRAMLFLVNEKDHTLKGTMAVGPESAEEAGRIWNSLSQKKGTLSDLITQLPPEGSSTLNSIVKGIQIPLEQKDCLLSRTVLEGRPFNTQFLQSKEGWPQPRCERGCHLGSEVGCYVGEHLSRDPRVYSFATVPLIGKGKVIGVIVVDNLYNQNPIREEDIHFLGMFATQAGLAIENAILYRNLEEVHQELKETQNLLIHQEKMVALGELSNSIAHEIKNPLVSIGGFARRLYRTIPEDTPEKRYTQTIIIGVARVEKILTDIFNYTHDESIAFKECDLRKIVEESLSINQERGDAEGVELVKEFSEEVPKINGDSHQLKQAFSHLIHNAYQAMRGQGTLSLRLYPISKNGVPYVRVEVEDTGGGVDPENLHNIFNPFYTTKDYSLGLGLPIVHKIITSHRGQIEVDNKPGLGVNFMITLPVLERGRESRFKVVEADK